MEKNRNWVFCDTDKMVLFIHPDIRFTLDSSLLAESHFIQPARDKWRGDEIELLYYCKVLREAALTDKKYLIIEYSPMIGLLIDSLRKAPDQYNFCRWSFLTFYNADKKYDLNDYPFIVKYAVSPDSVLRHEDLEKLRSDSHLFN